MGGAIPGRQVALLRGINVGRAKRVAMADLRALVEGLGFTDVKTLLNSGNVVFTAPRISPATAGARIEKALAEELGVSSRVTVLSGDELVKAVEDNPIGDVAENPSRLLVTVLSDQTDRARLKALTKEDWSPEVLALGERVAYLWCPHGILDSRLPDAVARVLGDAATSRNWATMMKLQALVAKPS